MCDNIADVAKRQRQICTDIIRHSPTSAFAASLAGLSQEEIKRLIDQRDYELADEIENSKAYVR